MMEIVMTKKTIPEKDNFRSRGLLRRFAVFGLAASLMLFQGCTWGLAALLLLNDNKSPSNTNINNETGDLVIARGNKDLGPTNEGANAKIVAFQFRTTATIDLTLQTLGIQGQGSGDLTSVSKVALHLDRNADGELGNGDSELASSSFDSAGKSNFKGLNFAFAKGQTEHFLVVLTLPGNAQEGDTFAISIEDASTIDARQVVSGFESSAKVFGLPVEGANKTVSGVGSLTVLKGPVSRDEIVVFPGTQTVSMLQLDLRASSVEALQFQSLTLKTSGSGNEGIDITGASLYIDIDSDGKLDLTIDTPLATNIMPVSDNRDLIFNGFSLILPPQSVTRLLVIYNFTATVTTPSDFLVTFQNDTDITAAGTVSNQAALVSGTPILGTKVNVRTVPVSQAAVVASGQALLPVPFVPSATQTPVLRINLEETGGEAVTLRDLTLSSSGTGNEAQGVLAAQLWNDVDNSGTVNPGDTRLATEEYTTDNGRLTFSGLTLNIPRFTTVNILVSVDTSSNVSVQPSDTFQFFVGIGDVTIDDADQFDPITPAGLPVNGGPLTVPPLGEIQVTQNSVPTVEIGPSLTNMPILALGLQEIGNDPVRIKSLAVNAAGSGNDSTDITELRLHLDADASATVSANDALLAIAFYNADNGTATFTGVDFVISANSQINLLVTYNTATKEQVTIGETFQVIVAANGFTLESATDSRTVAANGLPQAGASLAVPGPSIDLGPGTNNPSETILTDNDASNVVALQAAMTATPFDDVTITSVSASVTGTADDSTAILRAKLYQDNDKDGLIDGGDALLSTVSNPFSVDNGTVTFSGLSQVVPIGKSTNFLVAYDFASSSQIQETVSTSIMTNQILVGNPASVNGITTNGPAAQLLPRAIVTLSDGGAITALYGANQADAPVLRIRATESGGATARIKSLSLTSTGDSSAINLVRLWVDADNSGEVNSGDMNIGAAGFLAGNKVNFGALTQSLNGLGTIDLLVTLETKDVNEVAVGATFQMTIDAMALERAADGRQEMALGVPLAGPTRTVPTPQVNYAVGPQSPIGAPFPSNGQDVVALQVRLSSVSDRPVSVETLQLTASGEVDDPSSVVTAKLYEDRNGDGEIDGSNTLLAIVPTPFIADNGVMSFSRLGLNVAAGETKDLLVAFDFTGPTAAGKDFSVSIVNQADFMVQAPAASNGALPITGSILTASGVVTVSTLNAQSVGGREIKIGSFNNAVLYIDLKANQAENVTLNELKITGMGTLDFRNSISNMTLYRDNGDDFFDRGSDPALLLSTSPFDENNEARFLNMNTQLKAGESIRFWVTINMAGVILENKSLQFAIAGPDSVLVTGDQSGTAFTGVSGVGQVFQMPLPKEIFTQPSILLLGNPAGTVVDLDVADFNKDGLDDLGVLYDNDQVGIEFGNGQDFNGSVVFGDGLFSGVVKMVVGDISRDGFPDIIVAYPTKLRMYINQGAAKPGEFSAFTDLPNDVGEFNSDVEITDVNQDGFLDLLSLTDNFGFGDSGQVRVRINNSGTFGPALKPFTNLADEPEKGVIADFDGNGKADYAFIGNFSELNVAGGDGQSFGPLDKDFVSNNSNQLLLAKADINRDSYPDLFVLKTDESGFNVALSTRQAGNYVNVNNTTIGTATGAPFLQQNVELVQLREVNFAKKEQLTAVEVILITGTASEVISGDWNGDGVPDALFGFLAAKQDGARPLIPHIGKGDGAASVIATASNFGNVDVIKIATGDFNRDGDLDLVVATSKGGSLFFLPGDGQVGSGSPEFAAAIQVPFGSAPSDAACGDFDRDGDVDFVQITEDGVNELGVYLNRGTGRAYKRLGRIKLSGRPLRVFAEDGNRDGALDLYVIIAGDQLRPCRIAYLQGSRDGRFDLKNETVATGLSDDMGELTFVDLDRDGDLDAIATVPNKDTLQVFRTESGRLLDGTAADRVSGSKSPRNMLVRDFNCDGISDVIVLSEPNASVDTFFGKSDGTLDNPVSFGISSIGTLSSMDVSKTAFGGDFTLFLSSKDQNVLSTVNIASGNGGQMKLLNTLSVNSPLSEIKIVDTDRDGRFNILGVDRANGFLTSYTFGGESFFAFNTAFIGAADNKRLLVFDLDGDGDMDIVTSNAVTNDTQIFFGR
jgi:hypothetical protein